MTRGVRDWALRLSAMQEKYLIALDPSGERTTTELCGDFGVACSTAYPGVECAGAWRAMRVPRRLVRNPSVGPRPVVFTI